LKTDSARSLDPNPRRIAQQRVGEIATAIGAGSAGFAMRVAPGHRLIDGGGMGRRDNRIEANSRYPGAELSFA
jgi:hypothetical protein